MPTNRVALHRWSAAIASAVTVLAMTAGCSSSGSAGTPTTSSSNQIMSADAATKIVDASYAGIGAPAPASGPTAQRGKSVWLITCPALPGCLRVNAGFEAAAKVLGWDLKVVDGKADPTTTINLIKQAVAAKADGIIEVPLDCPLIKSGLEVAKSASVPVLSWGGVDCNSDALSQKGDALFAAPVQIHGASDWAGWYAAEGKASAEFLLARLTQLGVTAPHILRFSNSDATLNAAEAKAFKATVAAECATCQLDDVALTYAQIAAGKGPQIFSSGIQAHPDANVLYYGWDAMLDTGLSAAVAPHQKQFKFVCCGDGGLSGLAQARARQDDTWAISAYDLDRGAWAVSDVMNRIFAHATTFPPEGGYSTFVDGTHNMPANGEFAKGSYDFAAAYTKIWQG
jgi:ribose transport system substrate-binding protein